MKEDLISVGYIRDLGEDGYFVAKLPDGEEVLVFRAAGVRRQRCVIYAD